MATTLPVRYPAYVCGVPGLRPAFGRIPSIMGPGRGVCGAIMGVEGVMGRNFADVALGLEALAQPDARDAWQVPAPLAMPGTGELGKVALFSGGGKYRPEPGVAAALASAARALTAAGYIVEEVELPYFAEGQDLWSKLVIHEFRETLGAAALALGDAPIKRKFETWARIVDPITLTEFSIAISLREKIAAAWQILMETYPVILMPNSWELAMTVDRDQGGADDIRKILVIQSPMLLPALLGLPGLSDGVPSGVQVVAGRFVGDEGQELRAGRAERPGERNGGIEANAGQIGSTQGAPQPDFSRAQIGPSADQIGRQAWRNLRKAGGRQTLRLCHRALLAVQEHGQGIAQHLALLDEFRNARGEHLRILSRLVLLQFGHCAAGRLHTDQLFHAPRAFKA
ncbi:MAG TPA: amidase family protein [Ensifer sp.]|nr:amidase family protein [Ensifer sp.]